MPALWATILIPANKSFRAAAAWPSVEASISVRLPIRKLQEKHDAEFKRQNQRHSRFVAARNPGVIARGEKSPSSADRRFLVTGKETYPF